MFMIITILKINKNKNKVFLKCEVNSKSPPQYFYLLNPWPFT